MLTLSQELMQKTLAAVRLCGGAQDECVVYWSGPLDRSGHVDGMLHPDHDAGPTFYEVNERWLDKTWVDLARSERTLRAQVHTHSRSAFHSSSDDRFPIVGQPGFLSLVLPNHAARNDLGDAFLCQLGEDGRWHEISIAQALVIG